MLAKPVLEIRLAAWKGAIRDSTKAVFLESISNPVLEVIDIAAVAELTHAVGATLIVDNVFATPVFSRALALGADVVVYSTTKHIDGQGRCLGGVILGTREFIRKTVEPYLKHTGGALSPFNAWVMLKGLETLEMRCRAQAESWPRPRGRDHEKSPGMPGGAHCSSWSSSKGYRGLTADLKPVVYGV